MDGKFDLKSFYLFDLVKKLFTSKNNIPAIIYLVLNIAFVAVIFYLVSGGAGIAILYGVLVYLVAAVFAMSPIGEWILRLTQGCKKLKFDKPEHREILDRIVPLFAEAMERARSIQTEYVIGNVKLYLKEDDEPNAFALGRTTICVTTGLLNYSDEEIVAILGHEIGHLAAHDTDLVLLITVGNFIISAIVTIFKAIILLYKLLINFVSLFFGGTEGALGRALGALASFLTLLAVDCVMFLWTQLGVLLVMKTSRDTEFAADAFSCRLGYGEGLVRFFDRFAQYEGAPVKRSWKERAQLFAALSASHPSFRDRIARLQTQMEQEYLPAGEYAEF